VISRSRKKACSPGSMPSSPNHATRKRDQLAAPALAGDHHHLRADEVVDHALPAPSRDARHGVGQVAVEAREEAEPVLGGDVGPPIRPRAGEWEAARLAAEPRAALVHAGRESAVDELVRGAQAADAAAEHRDRS